MNITLQTAALDTELSLLSKVVHTKPTIPVLSNVLFSATDSLTLQATDLELGLISKVEASITEPGRITLPVKKLQELIKQFSGDVNITTDGTHVKVSSGAFKSRLQALAANDFPQLPTVEGDSAVLSAYAFRQLIDKVSYAINPEEKRFQMGGSLLSLNGAMVMVATDGKRLSSALSAYEGPALSNTILPKKTLDVLAASTYVGDIEFSKGERHLFFQMGPRLLISRMLDGEFPNYDRIIPRLPDTIGPAGEKIRGTIGYGKAYEIVADRTAFASALRRVGLVSEKNQACYIEMSAGKLALSAQSAEIGSADEELPATYSGEPLKICCSWRYVLDFLEAATSPTVTMEAKNELQPLLFTDENLVGVVMVMRT